jgi:two-component system nitrogen regulation sensor histidine kinase NtrY
MTTVRQFEPRPKLPPRRPAPPAAPERRPFRDNPRLILAGIVSLLLSLAAIIRLSDRTTQLNPDFLSEVVLYALSIVDVTMLLALGFVLARNLIKLVVERRRGLPFSRFRLKLVAALLGLTIVPSVLVLLAGSELIRQTTSRWFSQPVSTVLSSANAIAFTYYRDREAAVAGQAQRLAASVPAQALLNGDLDALKASVSAPVMDGRVGLVEIYRLQPGEPGKPETVVPVVALQSPSLPPGHLRGASSDRLAAKIAGGSTDTQAHEPLEGGGELVRAGIILRDGAGKAIGVVIASDYLSGDLAGNARRIVEAYEDYSQLAVLKGPLEAVYLSLFLMMTLMILVSATWLATYLAKRITRPVGMLAAGAREIGAGHLDHRIEAETRDEFGSLIEAFNSMAGEWRPASGAWSGRVSRWSARTPSSTSAAATSRRCSSASPPAWCRSGPTAGSARSTPPPPACSRSIPASSARRSRTCSGARICCRSARSSARCGPGRRSRPRRRLRSPAKGARSISRPRRRRSRGRRARTRVRSSCSTT